MYIDTHLDTLYQSQRHGRKFSDHVTPEEGHIDLHRARQAGLFIGYFTGFPTESAYLTQKMVRDWLEFTENPQNHIRRIASISELDTFYKQWNSSPETTRDIGAVLHFEGAAGIDTELNLLYIYYDLGLRSLSLTWNEQNQFATGVKGDPSRGLTNEGKDLLDTMEDLGIIIDISHLNDKSFWDVISHTNSPIIASHSNLRDPADVPRNLTDEMVQAIADSNGSVGINFCNGFLSHDQEVHKANMGCAEFMINKVINLTDTSHVHIGSDFDGCGTPDDIPDVTAVPALFDRLSKDLDNHELDNVKHGNMMRIMREVWN